MRDSGSGPAAFDRLQGALVAAGLFSWSSEPANGRLVWAENGFAGAGWRPSELSPSLETWLERIHPEDRPGAAEALTAACRTRGAWQTTHRLLLPGAGIAWCRAAGQVHVDETGAPVGMTGVLQQITADVGAGGVGDDGPASRSGSIIEDRNRVLLKELQHRVRNSLATFRSIVRHSVTRGRSVEEYVEYLDGRTAAYARVQSAAIQDPLAALDLELFLRDALTARAVPERQVRIEGPRVSLRPGVAEQMAIAFHELTTYALVHGAWRAGTGQVELVWQWAEPLEDGRLSVRWTETTSAPMDPEGPSGFGTGFLTKFLPYTLKAVVVGARTPSGVAWEIVLPDPEVTSVKVVGIARWPEGMIKRLPWIC